MFGFKLTKIKIVFSIATFLLIVVAGTVIFFSKRVSTSQIQEVQNGSPVSTVLAEQKSISKTFKTQTFLLPWKEATLKPMPQTTVQSVNVQVGEKVEVNHKLASLESEAQSLRSELDKVEMEIRNIDFGVNRALAANSFISKKEFRQKELEFKANQLRQKMAQIDNAVILRSPIQGRVSEINLKSGDYIDPQGQFYIRVVDDGKFRVQVYVPSEVAEQLNAQTKVFIGSTIETTLFAGKLASISPSVDTKTGTVFTETHLETIPVGWKVGSLVEVSFLLKENPEAIVIPAEAIIFEKGKPFVYKVQSAEARGLASETSQGSDIVKKVSVVLGMQDQGQVEIQSGLLDGDAIVVQGQGALSDGAKVEVVE